MNSIASVVTLQAAPAQGPSIIDYMILIVPLFAIWYLLVIRPQQRRQKEHDASLKAAEKGDTVVTKGGLRGTIAAVKEGTLSLEVASVKGAAVHVEIENAYIDRLEKSGEQKTEKGGGAS